MFKWEIFGMLVIIATLSCTRRKVDIHFKAYYYMHVDSINFEIQDKYGNTLVDSAIDAKKNINVRFHKTIVLPSSALRIKVNTVDSLVNLIDYEGCEKLSVEFNNMYMADDDTSAIIFDYRYEKVVIKPVCNHN